jgi:hypothetical protein
MKGRNWLNAFRGVMIIYALVCLAGYAGAETLVENSAEARFQLDVHVPDAALMALLPQGWSPNVAAQGAAKDANQRLVFI